jgi:hypothetical protein
MQNDCSIAVATSLPLTLLGDLWYDDISHTQGAALVFVFPFERHLHDYAHVQIMLRALLDLMEKIDSPARIPFQSYTTVFLYSSATDRIRAISRRMARDAEIALLTASAPWLHVMNSPRFACSTVLRSEAGASSSQATCAFDACGEEVPAQSFEDDAGTVGADVRDAGHEPLVAIVAIGATGGQRRACEVRLSPDAPCRY